MTKRRSGFNRIEISVTLILLMILAAVLLPAFTTHGNYPSRRASCSSNLKQIGLAFMQYSQEYNGQMPPVKFNANPVGILGQESYRPYGWMDALQPYLKSTQLFQCPSEPQTAAGTDPTQRGYTDYWYNTNLSKVQLHEFNSPSQTLMAGDGNDGTDNTDARYSLNKLPPSWITTEKSPARRHLDTGIYLYVDGHVKSNRPQTINNLPVSQSDATFAVK